MRARLFPLIAILLLTALPSSAAASGEDVIADCVAGDGRLSKTYSQADYREALRNLPADADQYSPCRDAIRAAARGSGISRTSGGSGTPSGGGSWGGSAVPGVPTGVDPLSTKSPEEAAEIAKAAKLGSAPVTLDGRPVDPSKLGAATVTSVTDLPAPLLALLILVSIATVAVLTRTAINARQRRAAR
ncbi:MAG: hypothetical protein V9E83_12825 [Baekduia sp.]